MNQFKLFLIKIKIHIPYQYFLNIIYKLKIWSPKIDSKLEDSINEFIEINKKHWVKRSFNNEKNILVEGHLANYGINYLYRSAITSLSIQEIKHQNIKIIYPGFDYQCKYANIIYSSFGIDDFIYIRKNLFLKGIIHRIKCIQKSFLFKKKIINPGDIIKIKFDNLNVGDLIYDDILKKYNLNTIYKIDHKVHKSIIRAYRLYLDYKHIFDNNNFSYYVATHTAYTEYGLLCRVALKHNVIVIETTDLQTSIFKNISANNLPTYHQGIINLIVEYLNNNLISDLHRDDSKINLLKRMDAEVKQIDVQKAYRGKLYERNELTSSLGLDKSKKNIFILAHIFTDSPHTSSKMLFHDYFVWLKETLNIISKINNVNWIIKPHPATSLYKEDGIIENMIDSFKNTNIRICPNDFNTKSIIKCGDCIVTVHGTAGLEFACLGIPVILCGKPFYSNFGFTFEPSTYNEYNDLLTNINQISKLTNEQIIKALDILYIWNTQFDWNNPIITLDILQDIWGSDRDRNVVNAFKKITNNIKINNPKDLKLWSLTQKLIN